MKTWPGTILQQQLRYGVVVLTFSFLQRCELKLKMTQAELIVLHATRHLPTRENILTTGILCIHTVLHVQHIVVYPHCIPITT